MAAEKARQVQQLEAFVNQNGARPCTPSTVLREARVRHGCDVNHLLRATAPPAGPAAASLSRRSPTRHRFSAVAGAAATSSSPTSAAFCGGEEEADAEGLDEADLRMLDAGFAGEGDGWRGDPRQRSRPRLPATITIKAPAPHRFGSVLLAPPAPAVAAAVTVSRRDSNGSSPHLCTTAGSLAQLMVAPSVRLGPHIDTPPPAHPTPYAGGAKRISFACAPAAAAGPAGGTATGPTASSIGSGSSTTATCSSSSKVPRAPASVAVLMDRVSEDRVAAVLSAGVAAALSPRARTAAEHSSHPHLGSYLPRAGGSALQSSHSPRLSAGRHRNGAGAVVGGGGGAGGAAGSMAVAAVGMAGSRSGAGCWTRRLSLECTQPALALSQMGGIAASPAAGETTGVVCSAGYAGPCDSTGSNSRPATQHSAAPLVTAPSPDALMTPRPCLPCGSPSTPRSVVGGRAATASAATGKCTAAGFPAGGGGSPQQQQAAFRYGLYGPAAAGPCGRRPSTTYSSSSVSDTAATPTAPCSPAHLLSTCSSPLSHRASACSSPLPVPVPVPVPVPASPPPFTVVVARRRSIDPQLSVVGGRASRAGSGSLAASSISPAAAVTVVSVAHALVAAGGAAGSSIASGDEAEPAGLLGMTCVAGGCVHAAADSVGGTDVTVAAAAAAAAHAAEPGSRSAPLPQISASPPGGALHQHQHQQHVPSRPKSRVSVMAPLSSDDEDGHGGASAAPAGVGHMHPPHGHSHSHSHGGGTHVCFDALPDLAAAGAAVGGLVTTSAPQAESLPCLRLSSYGGEAGGGLCGVVPAGAVTCRISELSSSGGRGSELPRATSRARRNSAPYQTSISGRGHCDGGGGKQQQQQRRPSDYDGSDGGAAPLQQPQRRSQSGAAAQVHVIGPVASPAAAAATEAAAVNRMARVMRAESRKGPADQDWTLDPEAVAAHAARVLGAASAEEVPAAAASAAAFGRGHCVRLHGHAHEPAPAPRLSADGGVGAGAAADAFPEETPRRHSHTGEGADAALVPSAGGAVRAGLGGWPDVGLGGPPPTSAAVPAAAGHVAVPRLPQPQRLPFLPGVSRLRSKLTPGGPQMTAGVSQLWPAVP
ncbi:hypothetical protein HXX76_000125 [Chlamydomonas incerta]|uniref:Uncharacterized protein n=1 Tax=Chlamydomonas incerta TaxID=51695 RepID=A0A836B2L8_CHLIN|nr:hypothetical protein HXX76_000125 [Chlamydomonas incerta]|eukprot:KAG2445509.1 hypothetical protein HXX76_000125 [Chlamydomonas incerta]